LPPVVREDDEILSAEETVGKTILGGFEASTIRERKHRTPPPSVRYIRAR
jgi:hypothetical protein